MVVLVLTAVVAIVASHLWARRHLDPTTPAGAAVVALRAAALLLLLLIVLQPSRLPKPEEVSTKRVLALLVDGSASMSRPAGGGATGTRLDEARRLIRDHRLFDRITAAADVALYAFDTEAPGTMPLRPEALPALKPAGRQTDLATTIEQVARLHKAHDLAGLLLFSDGRHTQGSDPAEAAARAEVPVHVVAVGRAVPAEADPGASVPLDLAVVSAVAEPRIILGRSAQVVATITAQVDGPRQVRVELLADDRVVATSAVAVSPRQPKRQALFNVRPDTIDAHRYVVRVPVEPDEADPTNNTVAFSVEVLDPVNRLLYLDRLRFERRFLHAVLADRPNLRYAAVVPLAEGRTLVQGNDQPLREEAADLNALRLAGLKALVLGDLPATALSEARLTAVRDWVDTGGALLLLGGPQSLGAQGLGGPLADLLPVRLALPARYVESPLTVRLTPEGAAHPAFQRVDAAWDSAPPLLSRFDVSGVRPAATVLFAAAGAAPAPIVVSWRVGHGKAAVVLTDSIWRWQLAHKGSGAAGASAHERFWQQVIDWLLPDLRQDEPGAAAVQLITDRVSYEVNEPVTMMVTVRGGDGASVANATVLLTIATPDPGAPAIERTATATASRGATDELVYTANFEAYAPGEYAIAAVARDGERALGSDRVQVTAVQPLVEFALTEPDPALLRQLASASGGLWMEPAMLDDIVRIAELAPRRVLVQPSADKDAEPVWDRWWLLALFVLLLAVEWAVRRTNQWV